jgi:hypothetical protein
LGSNSVSSSLWNSNLSLADGLKSTRDRLKESRADEGAASVEGAAALAAAASRARVLGSSADMVR